MTYFCNKTCHIYVICYHLIIVTKFIEVIVCPQEAVQEQVQVDQKAKKQK